MHLKIDDSNCEAWGLIAPPSPSLQGEAQSNAVEIYACRQGKALKSLSASKKGERISHQFFHHCLPVCLPEEKHSQYSFRHLDFLQLHFLTSAESFDSDDPPAIGSSSPPSSIACKENAQIILNPHCGPMSQGQNPKLLFRRSQALSKFLESAL